MTALATREAYRDALVEQLPTDDRFYCLDSDTGLFTGVDFGAAADRYVNLGIAEHNLIGTAAGLAASGMLPYVTTMATFATTRALEAIKVDVAYAGLPVRIAGTHAGLSAGHLGPTHHCLEDLGIVRMLPGFTVVVPASGEQADQAVRQTATLPGPVYLRLGKAGTPALPELDAEPFTVGTIQKLTAGEDLTIFACGPHPVRAAVSAARLLASKGIGVAVHNLHTLRPLDVNALVTAAAPAKAVITVEEHWRLGGLGSLVAETLAEQAPKRVVRIGMPDTFVARVGDQEDLLVRYGISDAHIAETAFDLLDTRILNGGRSHGPDLSRV
ncbi:transketolase family protein [Fodinicola feengrottensis]|uniref:Transketolase family protein n=1 Tax=Fodinicola feengrottensis TaxID=435914 RepID=A0ABP4SUN6_9ACTN